MKKMLARIMSFSLILVFLPGITQTQVVDTLFKRIEDVGDFLLYRNHDTNYISNYGNELSLRAVSVNKFNYFRLWDLKSNYNVRYRPVRDVSLGLGVSYRWFALDITFSLGLQNRTEFENTRSFDFQGKIFSSKQYISATVQYYQAYKLGSSRDLDAEVQEESRRREDIRTMNFGLQYLYAVNYTRFSIKAPFVFNEIQKQRAGSPIIGASFGMFNMDADSSVVPPEVAYKFDSSLYIHDIGVLMAGISLGYMYTYVIRDHFFITVSLIPGININGGDYFNQKREHIAPNIHFKLHSMNAIGYNGRKFHAGINFTIDSYFVRLEKKMMAEIGHGRLGFFIGYRFQSKRSKGG